MVKPTYQEMSEAFEKWAKPFGLSLMMTSRGTYIAYPESRAWTAWQACVELLTQPAKAEPAGCPCEPSGSDDLRCPDAKGQLLCTLKPSPVVAPQDVVQSRADRAEALLAKCLPAIEDWHVDDQIKYDGSLFKETQEFLEERLIVQTSPPAESTDNVGSGKSDALAHFTDYFVRNYPGPNTIIGNPHWHAPRIFRAAHYAIAQHVPETEKESASEADLFAGDWFFDNDGNEYAADSIGGLLQEMGDNESFESGDNVIVQRSRTLPSVEVIVTIHDEGTVTFETVATTKEKANG